jgi:hypothetical protein
MSCRTALLCLFAAMLSAGCNRPDVLPKSTQAGDLQSPADRPNEDRLARPVPVEAEGKPLVRQGTGYALQYPFVGDLDGDGRQDLLLGDRERGRLRVYCNVGTRTAPRLTGPKWFDDLVPTGKVPYG